MNSKLDQLLAPRPPRAACFAYYVYSMEDLTEIWLTAFQEKRGPEAGQVLKQNNVDTRMSDEACSIASRQYHGMPPAVEAPSKYKFAAVPKPVGLQRPQWCAKCGGPLSAQGWSRYCGEC